MAAKNQPPVFGEDPPAPEVPAEAFVLNATLVSATQSAGSASGGTKMPLKFEVHGEELAGLIGEGAFGQQSFDVTFEKADFGTGVTLASGSIRKDEDGAGRSWIVLIVPETEQPKLSAIASRRMVGLHGQLILEPTNVTLDEVLTKRAE
ncbi:MAG: hypothetical protein ACOYB2_10830 [Limnohabitans sp.]